MDRVPAVILAGGKAKPDLLAATGLSNRALIVVNGKTLLRRAVDALHEADPGNPITVVGDVPECEDYKRLSDTGDFVGNLFAGVSCYADSPSVLVATSDLPFLDGATVQEFVRGALGHAKEANAAIVYPIVPVAACYQRFPGVKRTSLKLREGEFTGGNLMLARPGLLLAHRARIAEAYAARKAPVRLAVMLGFGTLLRLLFSQKVTPNALALSYLEARVSRLLGCPARALICDRPEIATDLDRLSDFEAIGVKL